MIVPGEEESSNRRDEERGFLKVWSLLGLMNRKQQVSIMVMDGLPTLPRCFFTLFPIPRETKYTGFLSPATPLYPTTLPLPTSVTCHIYIYSFIFFTEQTNYI